MGSGEGVSTQGTSTSSSNQTVDKFLVRPKINDIYDQVLCNLPAIEDNVSDDSDEEVQIFARNLPSLSSKILSDFVDDPEELSLLIDQDRSKDSKAAASSYNGTNQTNPNDSQIGSQKPNESTVELSQTYSGSSKMIAARDNERESDKRKRYEDYEEEADRIVRDMFASDRGDYQGFASVRPQVLNHHGLTQNSFDSFLGRVSPEMREVISPSMGNRLDHTDSNIFRPLQNGVSGSGDRMVPDNQIKFPTFDPDAANDLLMDRLSKLAVKQKQKLHTFPSASHEDTNADSKWASKSGALTRSFQRHKVDSQVQMSDMEVSRSPMALMTSAIGIGVSTSPIPSQETLKLKIAGTSTEQSSIPSSTIAFRGITGSAFERRAFQLPADLKNRDPSLVTTEQSSDSSDDEESVKQQPPNTRLWHEERRMMKQQLAAKDAPNLKIRKPFREYAFEKEGETVELDLASKAAEAKLRTDLEENKSQLIEDWAWPKSEWYSSEDKGDAQEQEDTTFHESAISVSSFITGDEESNADDEAEDDSSSEDEACIDESYLRKFEQEDLPDYELLLQQKKQERARLEAIRDSRIRLKQQLSNIFLHDLEKEGKRPLENTEPLYDLDESYTDPLPPLPKNVAFDHMLLLTVKLSEPNKVDLSFLNSESSNNDQKTPAELAAQSVGCFCALLSWILSLSHNSMEVLSQFKKVHSNVSDCDFYIPFFVLSAQQAVIQSQLVLQLAVTPSHPISFLKESYLKTKKKSSQANAKNIFYQIVSKFLNSVKLPDVVDWNTNSATDDVLQNYVYAPRIPDCLLSSLISISGDKNQALHLFDSMPGFFWHVIDNAGTAKSEVEPLDKEIAEKIVHDSNGSENVLSLIDQNVYSNCCKMYHLLITLSKKQLDLSGFRLLHPFVSQLESSVQFHQFSDFSMYSEGSDCQAPLLALAVRGRNAVSRWSHAVGPVNPVLARVTDPESLSAKFGSDSYCYIYVPRNRSRQEFVKFFATRVDANNSINTRECKLYSKFEHVQSTTGHLEDFTHDEAIAAPPCLLSAVAKSNWILLVSPLVPFNMTGFIVSLCSEFGFDLSGFRRCYIDSKTAQVLNIPSKFLAAFAPLENLKPTTCIKLTAENANTHSWMLINNLYNSLWANLSWRVPAEFKKQLFCFVKDSPSVVQSLGGDFEALPNQISTSSLPRSISHSTDDDCYWESLAIVCFVGKQEVNQIGFLLGQLSNFVYEVKGTPQYESFKSSRSSYSCDEIEILGVKFRSQLSKSQARELTVFEVGDPNYSSSIEFLSSSPCATVCVRAANVFERVKKLFNIDSKGVASLLPCHNAHKSVTRFMSYNLNETYKLIKLFFDDNELFPDSFMRPTESHYPADSPTRSVKLVQKLSDKELCAKGRGENKSNVITVKTESIYSTLLAGPVSVATCFIVKPDACFRFLPYILRAIFREHFSVVGIQVLQLSENDVKLLKSQLEAEVRNSVLRWSDNGPVCVIAVERVAAVTALLDLMGPCPDDPQKSKRLHPKSWTAQFGRDQFENAFFVPQTYKKGAQLISHFFPIGLHHSKAWQRTKPGNDSCLNAYRLNKRSLLLEKDRVSNTSEDVMSAAHSLLNQVNVLLLPYQLITNPSDHHHLHHNHQQLTSSSQSSNDSFVPTFIPPFVDILMQLKSKGANILALRMLSLNAQQAKDALQVLKRADDQTSVEMLVGAPCIAVAVHRDNAVICFDQMLGSAYEKSSVLAKYNNAIFRASTISEANELIPFFFDQLADNDYATVEEGKN